jgi:hypothetical protein
VRTGASQDLLMTTTIDVTPARLAALAFAAGDPLRLANFWAAALRWEMDDSEPVIRLVPTDATTFELRFRPERVEKHAKNRIHLDLTTASLDDQSATVEQLIGLGGKHVDVGQGPDDDHVVLADPEGNELCIIGPGNSFLAGCPRLGSITCDGTRETGAFWSEALGWPLVWDQDGETAIRAPAGVGPYVTWGPPVPPKINRNRLHLEVAPAAGTDRAPQIARLIRLGAKQVADGGASRGDGSDAILTDPDGNELAVLDS